jgi:GNAT superfamily N-acetyltransferase
VIRAGTVADVDAIGRVAEAAGQRGEWTGADAAYVSHLLGNGRMAVAIDSDRIVGFGAVREILGRSGVIRMLCDLFVDPSYHGRGYGRALLTDLWPDAGKPLMTFSSQHPQALPLYTSAGLDAWWPLLYLTGDVRAVPSPSGWTVARASADEVSAFEVTWTGVDRTADHHAWTRRPNGMALVANLDNQPAAAGSVAGEGAGFGLVHLASEPRLLDTQARDSVLAVLAALETTDGHAHVCLPAPHPAVRPLLTAGWRITEMDVYMATQLDLLDPKRAVPSPALA